MGCVGVLLVSVKAISVSSLLCTEEVRVVVWLQPKIEVIHVFLANHLQFLGPGPSHRPPILLSNLRAPDFNLHWA